MSQTSIQRNFDEAFAGMKGDLRPDTVESYLAEGAIGFGLGVVAGTDIDRQVHVAFNNESTLTIDALLVTSNSTIATVNGNSTAPVVFITDHETTMFAIASAIAGLPGVLSATYSGAGADILIIGASTTPNSSAITTLGATQGAWTEVLSFMGIFRGIALHQHVAQKITTGIAQYEDKEAVSVLRKGVIWMPIEDSVSATLATDDVAFINIAIGGTELGKVTDTATDNIATGGSIRKVNAGLKLALVEIDL